MNRGLGLERTRLIAQDLVVDLLGFVRRIEIAGSIRRHKVDPSDIELVAIAGVESEERRDLFGHVVSVTMVNHLEDRLRELLDPAVGWTWQLDQELPRNGPRYKRLRHKALGICCDLFLTTERGWGGAMAIRTGPADFSQALVTLARRQGKHVADGYLIHGHPKPRRLKMRTSILPAGEVEEEYPCPKSENCPLILPTPEEGDFLSALGLPHWDPAARTAERVWNKAKGEVKG